MVGDLQLVFADLSLSLRNKRFQQPSDEASFKLLGNHCFSCPTFSLNANVNGFSLFPGINS